MRSLPPTGGRFGWGLLYLAILYFFLSVIEKAPIDELTGASGYTK
jgi:hypothetical protein